MMILYVWGVDQEVSVISPESLASVWLVSAIVDTSVEIVTSNNTNLSKTGRLPALLTDTESLVEGYLDISRYICDNYRLNQQVVVSNTQLSSDKQLLNRSMLSFIDTTIKMINQYNLYICRDNYEKFTRKLFKWYLPFPMMYNQPLKYYNSAQEEVKTVGIGNYRRGFLFGDGGDEADRDEYQQDNTTPISKLHERQLLEKNNKTLSLRETRDTLRVMNLIDDYISTIKPCFQQLNPTPPLTTSEILFFAYIKCLCWSELPDKLVSECIKSNHVDMFEEFTKVQLQLDNFKLPFRPAVDHEVPSLLNEIKYRCATYSQYLLL